MFVPSTNTQSLCHPGPALAYVTSGRGDAVQEGINDCLKRCLLLRGGNVTAVCTVALFSPRLQGQVLQKRSRIWQSASTSGFWSLVYFSVSQSGDGTGPFPVANHVDVCAPGSYCWIAQHRDLGVCVCPCFRFYLIRRERESY